MKAFRFNVHIRKQRCSVANCSKILQLHKNHTHAQDKTKFYSFRAGSFQTVIRPAVTPQAAVHMSRRRRGNGWERGRFTAREWSNACGVRYACVVLWTSYILSHSDDIKTQWFLPLLLFQATPVSPSLWLLLPCVHISVSLSCHFGNIGVILHRRYVRRAASQCLIICHNSSLLCTFTQFSK
jgi:hypothetical protein